jgi:hypothetical protein
MQRIFQEMKLERFLRRYKKWRNEGLLKALSVMKEVLVATAWYNSFRFYLDIVLLEFRKSLEVSCIANLYR